MSAIDPTTVTPADAPATSPAGPADTATAASAFSRSVVISGVRCILAYIVFPWILPLVGLAAGVGAIVGIVVSLVAIGFNVASIRRFWHAEVSWRWAVIAINVGVIGLLSVLLALDINALL